MNTEGSFRSVINLGNSIIGVSILAMPYCFYKCGILLSILLILASGCLTKATCHLLLKAAIMGRRRNFEFLAFHTFGTMGKFAVELGIIGFLLGACIAFFVVVGDLGPPLVADIFFLENTSRLRVEVLLILGFFVGLPLGLLKRVESLTSCSTLSVIFYVFLVFKILIEALPNLSYEKLFYEMNWWQPSGLLSCLPIFAMALSCQTQLFEIFDTHNDPNLKRMDSVVSSAVNLCSVFYTTVGLFGYAAFYNEQISGNILVKLPGTDLTKLIKLCFVLTIVVSFPLCLFPCRSSLHSLLFKPKKAAVLLIKGVSVHDMAGNLIPDHRFRLLTFLLVAVTIGTAIMVPNIEFVLGLLGSTIGAIISFILPAMVFIRMTNKNTNERLLAKFVLCVGAFILIACSYSTLNESAHNTVETPVNMAPILSAIPKIAEEKIINKIESQIPVKPTELKIPPDLLKLDVKDEIIKDKGVKEKETLKEAEKRQEPPIPQEPEEVVVKDKPVPLPTIKVEEKPKEILPPSPEPPKIKEHPSPSPKPKLKESKDSVIVASNANNNDIDPDALKKEDKELKSARLSPNLVEQIEKKAEKKAMEAERKAEIAEKKAEEASQKQDELLRKIEAQQREQKKLLEEQRKLLLELKEHKESHHKDDEVAKPTESSEFNKQNAKKPLVPKPDERGVPIVPNPEARGVPIVPNPEARGVPIVPNPESRGVPIVPNLEARGVPIVPNPEARGVPIVPNPEARGVPIVPNPKERVGPIVPNPVANFQPQSPINGDLKQPKLTNNKYENTNLLNDPKPIINNPSNFNDNTLKIQQTSAKNVDNQNAVNSRINSIPKPKLNPNLNTETRNVVPNPRNTEIRKENSVEINHIQPKPLKNVETKYNNPEKDKYIHNMNAEPNNVQPIVNSASLSRNSARDTVNVKQIDNNNNDVELPHHERVKNNNLDIPVAKRLSDSFQNKKPPSQNDKLVISKRSVTADPYMVNINISKPDVNISPSKMSYAAVKNEIRKLLEYHKDRKDDKKRRK